MNSVATAALAAIDSTLTQEEREEFDFVVWQKFQEAMRQWAMETMGKDREKYYAIAWEDFLTNLAVSGIRNLRRAGNDEHDCMEISGHKTRAVFDRYDIIDEDNQRRALERQQEYRAKQLMLIRLFQQTPIGCVYP